MSLYKLKKITVEDYLKNYLEAEYCDDDLVFGLEHYMNNFDFDGNLLTAEQISDYNMNMSACFSHYPLDEIDYLSEEWDENQLTYVIIDDLIWEIPIDCAYKALELKKATMTLGELRRAKGLTLRVVSKETKLSISTISKAEIGTISISPKIAKALSNFYGVEIEPRKLVSAYTEYRPVGGERERVIIKLKEENKNLKCRLLECEQRFEKIKKIIDTPNIE